MGAKDSRTYDNALKTWVAEHPFLDGRGNPSSAVFDAVITARALRDEVMVAEATNRELSRGAAANPFLAEFYAPRVEQGETHFPPEHVGIIYASLRARLSIGETASLLIEGTEDEDDAEALRRSAGAPATRANEGDLGAVAQLKRPFLGCGVRL